MSANLKLHQLRAFVDVARQGSIRAASRLSGLSQPALTKAIQELERELGARLFIRRQQGVVLTDIGDNFFRHASLVLAELRVAQEDIQQRLGLGGGQVNIGVGGSVARTIMPQVINQFHREYPLVKVRIVEGQLVSMVHELRQGALDFTINTYDQSHLDQELMYERMMEREYKVVVRKGHPLEKARSLAALQQADWTMPTPKG
ncbi:MAG TPA: LysR family transcriptional regulator, partial [Pantoea sp.]|nr:LysR family transcriptional regulator [Pantoea sp.]